MKKILSFIALTAVVCAFGFTACGKGDKGDDNNVDGGKDFNYSAVVENGSTVAYTIKDIGGVTDAEIVIPSSHNGLPVTGIDEKAFKGCTSIESVTLGENITRIGANAFSQCENIASVHVGSVAQWCGISFASMGANPMYFASQFYAAGALVENLVIPDGVTEIPDFAFYECGNIKSVKIGGDVTKIGCSAFYACEKLESASIGGNIKDMGELAFADCVSLKTLEIGDGVEIIGEYAFLQCAALEEVTIPSSIKRIERCAFLGCGGITDVNLNEGLQYIGDCAFSGCSSLTEFDMPSSVSKVGFGVVMFGADYGFGGSSDSFNQVGKITLSDNLVEIPDFAFSYCGIKSIVIGEKVTKINYSAFYGCGLLESIIIPTSVTNITSYAFYKCPLLNTVYYGGTAEEWSAIKIGKNGNAVSTAEVYFYSEEQPAQEGNFWHYADGSPVKW